MKLRRLKVQSVTYEGIVQLNSHEMTLFSSKISSYMSNHNL